MVGSGALGLTAWSLPPSQPSENVIKALATVQHVGPLDPSYAAPPKPPRARPRQPASRLTQRLARVGSGTWQAWLAGLKALPAVILHRSTRLRVQAQRKDSLPSLAGPRIHTRTGGRPLGPSSNQWHSLPFPLWPCSTRTVSAWGVGATPGTNGAAKDQRGNPGNFICLSAKAQPTQLTQGTPIKRS